MAGIRNQNIAADAAIDISKLAWRELLAPKHTDGTLPRYWYVSKGGHDGNPGTREQPLLTVGMGVSKARSGRGDVILVGPGEYAETVDVNKSDLSIIGCGNHDRGLVQIIGDGSTAQATIQVLDGFTRGFRLANLEVDTNGVSQPAIHIQTNNVDSGGYANTGMRWYVEHVQVNSSAPTIGLLLDGASMGVVKDCYFGQVTIGIGLKGSANNFPDNILFKDVEFTNNVTADVATVTDVAGTIGSVDLQDVRFVRPRFNDRGGTPVTNYINLSTGTMVNVNFVDARFARDVADGTLMVLPADVIVLGHSAAGVESIIGA